MVLQPFHYARATGTVTSRDVLRLYKEMMKAAMTVSNPKLRILVYDSIRNEFRTRKHMTDSYAISEAMTRGVTDLESLRDARLHPFLYANEDGVVTAPRIDDPNAPVAQFVPGPILSLVWGLIFIGGGGMVYGFARQIYDGGSMRWGWQEDGIRQPYHKGIPATYQGTQMNWQHEAPTGLEIKEFRDEVMHLRTKESALESELLTMEAKCYARSILLEERLREIEEAEAAAAAAAAAQPKGWLW
eukprot:TRINITY_DN77391_c0_g1_i1.p1 TRINITY_DN77391_c0_g1~~TRINITY_DN77391_c0_g1_i1.p1  ORF type:complete len:262 (+),score=42.16 TRINITY_DN77391_c0_g1_i1:57-788(+)